MEIKLIEPPFSDQFVEKFIQLNKEVFHEDPFFDGIKWRLNRMPDVTVFVALAGEKIVGFKAGYAVTINKYNSWLGGVDPAYRKQGIGKMLMEAQHKWVQEHGFHLIETQVAQDNLSMMLLNLDCGLEMTGMFIKYDKPFFNMERKFKKT